jgi:hypothetical protein
MKQEGKSILRAGYILKFVKSPRLSTYGHADRTQTQKMAKQSVTATVGRTKRREGNVNHGKT